MKSVLANSSVGALCIVAMGLGCALAALADFDLDTAVAIWHMDEGEGEETKDSSNSGNHGKLWRGPLWVDGRFGKALEFDGQSFVWIKEAKNIPEGTTPRTLMCHFKWTEIRDWGDAIAWVTDAETMLCVGIRNWRSCVRLQISAQGGPSVDTFDDRQYFEWDGDTDWHHFAAVFPEGATTSDGFLLYFDGVLQEDTLMDDDVNGINTVGGEATIGCWTGKLTNFFKGTVDEAAVFPFAMAAEDVASVARRGLVKGQTLDVSPKGKLAMSWGTLKER